MIHKHYKLITPETKEVKVEAEALEEDSNADDLVEDSKEEDTQADYSKEEDFKLEAADHLNKNITNTIPIFQKQLLAQWQQLQQQPLVKMLIQIKLMVNQIHCHHHQ